MIKKTSFYILTSLMIVIGVYYFFRKENTSIYSKSAGEISVGKTQGKFVPEKETDYIFVTTNSEFGLNFQNLIIAILLITVILLIVRRIKKNRKL